jgi:hypothetical protein
MVACSSGHASKYTWKELRSTEKVRTICKCTYIYVCVCIYVHA